MDKILYLVEGDTEEYIIKQLKNTDLISGSIEVWNICQKKVKNIVRRLTDRTIVIIVTDLDIHRNNSFNNYTLLAENLKEIRNNSKKVFLISQKDNLEDEIMTACNLNKNALLNILKVKSLTEFKSELIRCGNFKKTFNSYDNSKFWENKDKLILNKLKSYMNISIIELDTNKLKIK